MTNQTDISKVQQSDSLLLLVECEQLLHRFFQSLDDRNYDAMLGIFLEDARWLRQGRWLAGPAEIRAALDARLAAQSTSHVMTNAHITALTSEKVTLRGIMTAYRYDTTIPGVLPVLKGPFRINDVITTFARRDGALRIAEQQLIPLFDFVK